ncbi:Ras family protein [Trichomonas vaginalis G3]|uniref:Ras family protein n=1 Tax=Trichomonas vaginalis (strain ATCC PRA-98 / G3) TaxID=412133 RepID=A2E0G1_TRIV3|nr:GTPase protein [Trichomonas vaginalis G3]EAY13841.1 Ras family protein [Trichomonas vaginalis G3]KAI5519846.1 GTPase protein [Trichomonas vaginalis G3]|eukprot:XP_001326064.1 Ras family protein [Trichomonas vaginalis G3]
MNTQDTIFRVDEKVKIVFLGSPSVGKTSIMNRWICGDYNDRVSPTIAAANIQKDIVINNKEYTVVVCDTAGEERYHSLCGNYVRGAHSVIIVASYDLPSSMEAINSWVNLVYEICPETTPIIIAKNKKDLVNEEHCDSEYNGFPLFHVSAKTGEGIEMVFTEAIFRGIENMAMETTATVKLERANTSNRKENTCC